MCLELKKGNSKVKIAEEDIVCWKWLRLHKNGKLFSPYQCNRYYLNDRMKDDVRVNKNATDSRGEDITHTLDRGCFHTFKHYDDAKFASGDSTWEWSSILSSTFNLVVKCIIPKGSKYYEGDFCLFRCEPMESYASKELKITDEIHTSEIDSPALMYLDMDETYI